MKKLLPFTLLLLITSSLQAASHSPWKPELEAFSDGKIQPISLSWEYLTNSPELILPIPAAPSFRFDHIALKQVISNKNAVAPMVLVQEPREQTFNVRTKSRWLV